MSETVRMIEEMTERLFASEATMAVCDAAEGGHMPDALWTAFDEAGLPWLLTADGGGGPGELVALCRAIGRHGAPGPLAETVVANGLLDRWGNGETESRPRTLALVAADGRGSDAPWGGRVETLAFRDKGGDVEFVRIGPDDLRFDRRPIAVCEPKASLDLSGLASEDWTVVPGAFAEALNLAALARAGQILGALEWCLERSTDYVMERRQFGRVLGRFQAVQQHIAALAAEVSAALSVTLAAAERLETDDQSLMVAAARARLADAVDAVVWFSHQVHGAIGFSREYALNYRTRRLMQWRDSVGTADFWRQRLAAPFLGQPADQVWPIASSI